MEVVRWAKCLQCNRSAAAARARATVPRASDQLTYSSRSSSPVRVQTKASNDTIGRGQRARSSHQFSIRLHEGIELVWPTKNIVFSRIGKSTNVKVALETLSKLSEPAVTKVGKTQRRDFGGRCELYPGMLVDGRKVQLTRNPGFHCGRQGLPRRTGQLGKLGHAYGDLLVRRSPNMSPVPTMQRAPGTARHPCHSSPFRNPAAEGGANNCGERNHHQHGDETVQREGDRSTGNTGATAKKSGGIDNTRTLPRLRG